LLEVQTEVVLVALAVQCSVQLDLKNGWDVAESRPKVYCCCRCRSPVIGKEHTQVSPLL